MIKNDYAVFIGKFAPFHNGHLKIVEAALEQADYLIMVVGSANVATNTRIPWNVWCRSEMIDASLPKELSDRVIIVHSDDYMYNDVKWHAGIYKAVYDAIHRNDVLGAVYTNKTFKDYNHSICLVGMNKDETSYYLNLFPQWKKSIDVSPYYVDDRIVSATDIRKHIFFNEVEYIRRMVPEAVYNTIIHDYMSDTTQYEKHLADFRYENKYEMTWGKGPHVTVDACVIQSGHILLIKRGKEYGHGKLALPGGFINRNEKIEDAMIRELREETKIKVPEKVLRGSIDRSSVYDHPYRSNRSRIITHCYKIVLQNVPDGLPKVIGSDDAMEANWYPISYALDNPHMFFEDHYHILFDLLG